MAPIALPPSAGQTALRHPHPLLVAALTLGATLAACGVAFLFGVDFRVAFSGRILALSGSHALAIGVPLSFFVPWLVQRIHRPGPPLLLALAGGTLLIVALGCLLAGGVLVASGVLPGRQMWRMLGFNLRLGGLLALCSAGAALAYDALARRLGEAEARLREQELEKAEASRLAAQAQLSLLAARVHPHFLFNTLNAIASLVPRAPERAEQMVGRLADLLRASLDTASRASVPLREELELVRATLEIESARFDKRLRFELGDGGPWMDWPVPPHAIQGLVENAVKHSIAARPQGGAIAVAFGAEGEALRIDVRDDGPGFDLREVRPGHGLENLIARLDALYGEGARLEVSQAGGGCCVSLVLPREAAP
ncbi:MAG: histidine kinase [Acidobacteria bacterium]|nr:histidine kinase [Acidobacteriota bacterium]MBI3489707.1 histidine kinase [Acidobacteriota bacterium]